MIATDYDYLKQFEEEYSFIPVAKEIYGDRITPITLLEKLSNNSRDYYLLESARSGERGGRYSFLGFQPIMRINSKNRMVKITQEEEETVLTLDKPMDAIREVLLRYKSPTITTLPPFTGGFVGYFAYEMFQYEEPILMLKDSEFHDFDLYLFDKVIAFDHFKQKLIIISNYNSKEGRGGYQTALEEIDEIIRLIDKKEDKEEDKIINKEADKKENVEKDENKDKVVKAVEEEIPERKITCFKSNVSKETYIKMVMKAKEYIKEGDIFQVVLSRRFEAWFDKSLLNTYRVLRTSNPSPYMYYLHFDDIEIAGASPETLVKLEHGKLTTFPVAGTRKRGKTTEEDIELEHELLQDEKELAEHNMLVDLARNDIGRIAKFNSVKVEEYKKIHRFSNVMHIASVVTGTLKADMDGLNTISGMLPAGTLSGAPKIRACEIINELEADARGIYGGAIGYIDFTGNVDVCIAIRTAIKKKDKVYVQAGAGIVSDSVPSLEYEECGNKAYAVIDAIFRSGEVN